jgi:hypothetical protein
MRNGVGFSKTDTIGKIVLVSLNSVGFSETDIPFLRGVGFVKTDTP